MKRLLYWWAGLAVLLVRRTCRFQLDDDPRDRLNEAGTPHVFAALHAQQIAAIMAARRGSSVMVSRSNDGEMIVPTMRLLGHFPIRGSAGSRKGGAVALQAMVKSVRSGHPGILAVDGPRGPRGTVHKGIGLLAKKSGAAVIAVVVIPRKRWILSKTWDRLQVPVPFTTVNVHFAEPLFVGPNEELGAFASRLQRALAELEMRYDPAEAAMHRPLSDRAAA
jgi:lysophospholipid acyltransferase (LPLAT)-like uncharacterized protein